MKERRKLRLLLVEDDSTDAKLAQRVFQQPPELWEIVWARDGQEALDFLFKRGKYVEAEVDTWTPDLVFLNIMLPKLRGYKVLEALKRDPEFSMIPVVMWSISRMLKSIERSYRLGAAAYLPKSTSAREEIENLTAVCRFWNHIQLPS